SDVAIDPGTRVPAGIRKARMIDAYSDDIFVRAELHIRREVALETGVPVRSPDDELSVHPHLGMVVYAVELDPQHFTTPGWVELKLLTIPTDATCGVARAACVIRAQRFLRTPVVRQP